MLFAVIKVGPTRLKPHDVLKSKLGGQGADHPDARAGRFREPWPEPAGRVRDDQVVYGELLRLLVNPQLEAAGEHAADHRHQSIWWSARHARHRSIEGRVDLVSIARRPRGRANHLVVGQRRPLAVGDGDQQLRGDGGRKPVAEHRPDADLGARVGVRLHRHHLEGGILRRSPGHTAEQGKREESDQRQRLHR
jgi:hypothetical protein